MTYLKIGSGIPDVVHNSIMGTGLLCDINKKTWRVNKLIFYHPKTRCFAAS